MDHLVKVSVFLPETIHHQLKRTSVDRRITLQKVIADLAVAAANNNQGPAPVETIDSLSMVAPPGCLQEKIDLRTIKKWQNRLRRILESGHRLAILNCTASIEAMERLVKEEPSGDSVTAQNPLTGYSIAQPS
jgi:hypothetical protein